VVGLGAGLHAWLEAAQGPWHSRRRDGWVPEQREDKVREVQLLKQLDTHPHLVRLLEAWEQLGHLYMRIEYCPFGR
jgi:serine/threonine protein kinase